MLIKNEFEVAEPVEKVWRFFDNIPLVAACLPGAELGEDLGGEKYKGGVAVRMGPVRLRFAGTADITERDEAAKRIVVHAAGADEKGRGQAAMVVGATLSPKGRGTKVAVTQDLQRDAHQGGYDDQDGGAAVNIWVLLRVIGGEGEDDQQNGIRDHPLQKSFYEIPVGFTLQFQRGHASPCSEIFRLKPYY